MTSDENIEYVEIVEDTWSVFEDLFGPDGVEGGCWCAYFRQSARDFRSAGAKGHKGAVRRQVSEGAPFGIVAVVDGVPSGWVAVSPRLCNPRLERSVVARVDNDKDLSSTWSVTCFYAPKDARKQRLSARLLEAAISYARRNGATEVEGYPVDTANSGRLSADELYHGILGTFLDAGFELIERRGVRRALVRLPL